MLKINIVKINKILDILKEKYNTCNRLSKCNALEIGCGGDASTSRFLCNFFKEYTSTDISKDIIKQTKKITHPLYENLTYILSDITEKKI